MAEEYPADVVKGNTSSEHAFNRAVAFYELDHDLTKAQRLKLSDAYNSISYTSIGAGWSGFLLAGSIPFIYQRISIDKEKISQRGVFGAIKFIQPKGRTNLGAAIMFGIVGMIIASPIGSQYAYRRQKEHMMQTDAKCSKVMDLLMPSEAMKWWMYYRMTIDKPDLIMKDPRSQGAYERRQERKGKSALYENGRDPLQLYSGARQELKKKINIDEDETETEAVESAVSSEDSNEDPFETKKKANVEYGSAWDRIRSTKSQADFGSGDNASAGSSWKKVRQAGYQSPGSFSSERDSGEDQPDSFEEMLERERRSNDEEENRKW